MYPLPPVNIMGRVSDARTGISFLNVPVLETVTFFSLIVIIHATARLITTIIIIKHVHQGAFIDKTFTGVQRSMDVIVHSHESRVASKSWDGCW